jgi:hypothetical protein
MDLAGSAMQALANLSIGDKNPRTDSLGCRLTQPLRFGVYGREEGQVGHALKPQRRDLYARRVSQITVDIGHYACWGAVEGPFERFFPGWVPRRVGTTRDSAFSRRAPSRFREGASRASWLLSTNSQTGGRQTQKHISTFRYFVYSLVDLKIKARLWNLSYEVLMPKAKSLTLRQYRQAGAKSGSPTIGQRSYVLTPLNFKVREEFHREFKTYAAQNGKSMVEVLQEAFSLLKEKGAR